MAINAGNINIGGVGNMVDLTVQGITVLNSDTFIVGNTTLTQLIANSGHISGGLTVAGEITYANAQYITTDELVFVFGNNQSSGAFLDGGGIQVGNNALATYRYNYATNSWQSNLDITPIANTTQNLGNLVNYWNNLFVNNAAIPGNLIAGTVAGTFVGNGSGLDNIQAENIVGSIAATTAATVTTADQPNITSVGTLTSLSVSGNITASNIIGNIIGSISNAAYANTAATVTTAAQPNITSVGTLTTLTASGNIHVSGILTNNYYYANGQPISFSGGSSYSNANVAAYLPTYTGNLTAGNILTNNYLYANGQPFTPGTNYSNANVESYLPTYTGNLNNIINITLTGTISGNGALLTNITGSNVVGDVAKATKAVYANIANSISGSNVSGEVANAAYATTATTVTGNILASQVTGTVANATYATTANLATSATTAATVTTNAQPNITSIGTLSAITVTGNAIGGNLLTNGSISATGNLYGGNLVGSTSNVSIVAGVYSFVFDNTGNTTLANGITKVTTLSATGNIITNTGFGAVSTGPAGYTALPSTTIQVTANANTYSQMNMQNLSNGTQGTSEYVATANNGTDTTFFIDMGIAGNNYSNASANNSLGTSLWPNDGYLYVQGANNVGNLVVGTTIANTAVKFISGGSASGNIVMTLNAPTATTAVAITGNVSASGNITGGNVSVTGRIYAANGSASAPSIAFTSDGSQDTGLYWISDGNIGITTNNGLRAQIFDSGLSVAGTVYANSSNAIIIGPLAKSNVAINFPDEGAIRNYGTTNNNNMYFDINIGGSSNGNFTFRSSNGYTQLAQISTSGIKAPQGGTYAGKSAWNVALDTEVVVDAFTFRISNQGGVFPQVKSTSGGGLNTAFNVLAQVSGATLAFNQNSGFNLTTYATMYSTHGMDTAGDTVSGTVMDKTNGRLYRVTFVRGDNGSTTGYNIFVERLI